jgi:hypothetical protein
MSTKHSLNVDQYSHENTKMKKNQSLVSVLITEKKKE